MDVKRDTDFKVRQRKDGQFRLWFKTAKDAAGVLIDYLLTPDTKLSFAKHVQPACRIFFESMVMAMTDDPLQALMKAILDLENEPPTESLHALEKRMQERRLYQRIALENNWRSVDTVFLCVQPTSPLAPLQWPAPKVSVFSKVTWHTLFQSIASATFTQYEEAMTKRLQHYAAKITSSEEESAAAAPAKPATAPEPEKESSEDVARLYSLPSLDRTRAVYWAENIQQLTDTVKLPPREIVTESRWFLHYLELLLPAQHLEWCAPLHPIIGFFAALFTLGASVCQPIASVQDWRKFLFVCAQKRPSDLLSTLHQGVLTSYTYPQHLLMPLTPQPTGDYDRVLAGFQFVFRNGCKAVPADANRLASCVDYLQKTIRDYALPMWVGVQNGSIVDIETALRTCLDEPLTPWVPDCVLFYFQFVRDTLRFQWKKGDAYHQFTSLFNLLGTLFAMVQTAHRLLATDSNVLNESTALQHYRTSHQTILLQALGENGLFVVLSYLP